MMLFKMESLKFIHRIGPYQDNSLTIKVTIYRCPNLVNSFSNWIWYSLTVLGLFQFDELSKVIIEPNRAISGQ